MRVVVVETDAAGRSGVGRIVERTGPTDEEAADSVFSGPVATTAPGGDAEGFLDLSPGPGAAMWRIYELPPGLVYEMHHTDTVDFDVLVDGSMTLVLDRDEVDLAPGDGVLLRGDRHSWRAGNEGARMLFALLGSSRGHPPA
jgi:mannose-6-phosphate isomerase-like protein (cupin superfamily)